MPKFSHFLLFPIAAAASVLALAACTPTYNWREVHGAEAPFSVALPGKPATYSRPIDLAGMPLVMTMTATEVNGVTFAVGTARLPESANAQAALHAMKTALVKNIGGAIRHEKSAAGSVPSIDIEAAGTSSAASGARPLLLFARFAAKNQRVYQALVIGREKAVSRDAVDTFFTSFKLN